MMFNNSWHHAKTVVNNCFIMHFLNSLPKKTLLSEFTKFENTTQKRGLETRQACTWQIPYPLQILGYYINFTHYFILIECYWPIRLFLVSLMYNNIYHLTEESHPVCIHVTKRVSVELITISWWHILKAGVLTTNRHINSSRIDMNMLKCSCKVGYKINNNNQHMN